MGRSATSPLTAIERQERRLENEQVALEDRRVAIRRELRQLAKARALLETDDGDDES